MTKTNCSKCNQKVVLVNSCLCPLCGKLGVERMLTDSFEHANKEFPKIVNKLNKIQDPNLSVTDLRLVTIEKLKEASMWAAFQIKTFPDLMMKSNSPIPIYLKSINENVTDDNIKQLVSNFDLMNRASFLTMFLFQIEVFFEKLLFYIWNKYRKTRKKNSKIFKKKIVPNIFEIICSDGRPERSSRLNSNCLQKLEYLADDFNF